MKIRELSKVPRAPFFTAWQRFEFSVIQAFMFLTGVYSIVSNEIIMGILIILLSILIIFGIRSQNLYPDR